MKLFLLLLATVYLFLGGVNAQGEAFLPATRAVITSENAVDLKLIHRLGDGVATDLAWSPNGGRLAVASTIGAWVFDAVAPTASTTAALLPALIDLPAGASRIAYTDQYLIIGGSDGAITLVDAGMLQDSQTLGGHLYAIAELEVSPDLFTLISVDNSGAGRRWALDSVSEIEVFQTQPIGGGHAAVLSLNGTLARMGSTVLGGVTLTRGAESVDIGTFTLPFTAVEVFEDRVTAYPERGAAFEWSLESGDVARTSTPLPTVQDGLLSPDGVLTAWAQDDGTIRLFETEVELARLRGFIRGVTAIAFSPDSRLLAAGSLDGSVRLYDLNAIIAANDPDSPLVEGMLVLDQANGGHTMGVTGVAFSPDGTLLATTGFDGTVRLWGVNP